MKCATTYKVTLGSPFLEVTFLWTDGDKYIRVEKWENGQHNGPYTFDLIVARRYWRSLIAQDFVIRSKTSIFA